VLTTCDAPLFQHFIGGDWLPADANRVAERRNPADIDDLVGYIPLAEPEAIEEAVAAAERVAAAWKATPSPTRGQIIFHAAHVLRERAEEFAKTLTREQGKTIAEARGEVRLAIEILEYIAGEGRRYSGRTFPSDEAGRFVYTILQPVGTVGLITPWNFPVAVPLWKIAPALVAGNTIVWKPSRLTGAVSDAIVRLFIAADLPPGVLNLVNGEGLRVGHALAAHPKVRAISFTSSYEVGTRIYATAAQQFKKVQCEAGGKNAVIVVEDADVERAASAIAMGAFRYAGQRCTATSRVIVHDDVADQLVEALTAHARSMVVGDGLDPQTDMGPLSDLPQMTRVLEFLEVGRREGRMICGGSRLIGPQHDRGWFVPPTIFDNVSAGAQIAQEEIFGPVVAVIRVPSFSSALAAANSNRYGMTTSVFTRDIGRVLEAAENLECGVVHVNAATIGAEVHVPFGGIKHTGVGAREMGPDAVEFYCEAKVVYLGQ
jgi:acyl-CoA reductase-like NAD-dependent aldehyde dehydrogenase